MTDGEFLFFSPGIYGLNSIFVGYVCFVIELKFEFCSHDLTANSTQYMYILYYFIYRNHYLF